jgi:hypothetical protein
LPLPPSTFHYPPYPPHSPCPSPSPVLPFLPLGLLLVSRQEQRVRPSHQAQHPHPSAAAFVSPPT